jgi:hypothetical protein
MIDSKNFVILYGQLPACYALSFNFTQEYKSINRIAWIIIDTLPVVSEKQMNSNLIETKSFVKQ